MWGGRYGTIASAWCTTESSAGPTSVAWRLARSSPPSGHKHEKGDTYYRNQNKPRGRGGDKKPTESHPSGEEPHHLVVNPPVRGEHVLAVYMKGTTLHIANAAASFHNQ